MQMYMYAETLPSELRSGYVCSLDVGTVADLFIHCLTVPLC